MISAGEVGAVFTIVDEASPVLKRLMEQFTALQAQIDRVKGALQSLSLPPGINRSLGIADKNLKGIADSTKLVEANFAKMDGVMSTAAVSAGAMAREMRTAARAAAEMDALSARVPRLPSIRNGGGGGRGGGAHGSSGFGVTPPPVGAGGFHAHGSTAAMIGLGAVAYGVYEEAEIEDIVARAMLTGQLKVDAGMNKTDAFKSMRDLIQRVSAQTGYGPKEVGEALLTTERQFGGLSFKDRLGIEETLIPFAASEARMKEATLPEAFEAMVGLAHMTGTYDPKQLPELMRQFSYASMITPVPIEQFQRAISYSLPMLHAGLDMDPSAVMFLTAMTQTAGITNTKSGTWLRSFFENAEPRIGISKSDITHNKALQAMGLLDGDEKVTWQVKNAQGKTDWDQSIVKMSELINKFTTGTDPATRLGTLRQAFGERGGGEAALMNLSQFIEQFPVLQAKMKAFQGGDDVLKSLFEGSPVQQARGAWADLQSVLMDLGQSVLPPLTAGLSAFDGVLKALKATTGSSVGNAVIDGGLMAGVAAWFGRAAIWNGIKGLAGLALGRAGPWGMAAGGAMVAAPFVYNAMPGSGLAPGEGRSLPGGSVTRGALPYLNNPNLQGIGNEFRGGGATMATLQATVNTNVIAPINIDGNRVAEAILPRIEQKLEALMHSAMSALEGTHNDIAHRMGPGMAN